MVGFQTIEVVELNTYGPVPICDILDVAGRYASELIVLDRSIVHLGNTIHRLGRLVDATKHIPEPPPCGAPQEDPWGDIGYRRGA